MKATLIICSLIMISLISCMKEKRNVHFHGRITAYCNNQLPAKNQRISFQREYDTGTSSSEWVGETITDDNGYFSIITDVGQSGEFKSYLLEMYPSTNILQRSFSCYLKSYEDNKNVEINAGATPTKAYGFHIKNDSAFNGNDVFNSLITEYSYVIQLHSDTLIENLSGINVDTTIYRFFITYPIKFKYSVTKNNTIYEIPFDTISNSSCLDTLIVEILY